VEANSGRQGLAFGERVKGSAQKAGLRGRKGPEKGKGTIGWGGGAPKKRANQPKSAEKKETKSKKRERGRKGREGKGEKGVLGAKKEEGPLKKLGIPAKKGGNRKG